MPPRIEGRLLADRAAPKLDAAPECVADGAATAGDCILKWGAKLLSKQNGVRTILGDVRRHHKFG